MATDVSLILQTVSAGNVAQFLNPNDQFAIWKSEAGAFYAGMQCIVNDFQVFAIFKSEDDGASWALQDEPFYDENKPEFTARVCVVGEIAYVAASNFFGSLYSFDCSTDTWSVLSYQETIFGPPVGLLSLGGSDLYLLYDDNGLTPLSSSLRGLLWSGGWGISIDLGVASGLGTSIYTPVTGSTVDESGTVHVFYTDLSSFWYQSIVGGTLTVDYEFSGVSIMGGPIIVDDNIVVAASGGGTTFLYIGEGLSSPSWSTSDAVDTIESGSEEALAPPQVFTDGITFSVVIFHDTAGGFQNGLFHLSNSADLFMGWSVETIYDADTDPLPPGISGNRFVLQTVTRGNEGKLFVSGDWDVSGDVLGGFILALNDAQAGNEFI